MFMKCDCSSKYGWVKSKKKQKHGDVRGVHGLSDCGVKQGIGRELKEVERSEHGKIKEGGEKKKEAVVLMRLPQVGLLDYEAEEE